MNVFVEPCREYDSKTIDGVMKRWEPIFREYVKPGKSVVLKPNWIASSHKYNENEWTSVITHPAVITAVLKVVLGLLDGRGRVVITDGPQTQCSWRKLMTRMSPELWTAMGREAGVPVVVLDLRDDEWLTQRDVIIERKKLSGDPLGSTKCDLNGFSEFADYYPGKRGYFGADYNMQETNQAHSGGHHRYKVSRTVIASDVFINLPKMKSHKKAGITCSMKNLVGINTYKNWLPHHTEGTPEDGGDQFPIHNFKNEAEILALRQFRSFLSRHEHMGRWLAPVKTLGKHVFGDTRDVVRNGDWYGNQTIWRMILDLNKILFYANPDGTLRADLVENRKKYITIIDAIVAGEGNGPEAPTPRATGRLIAGTNPVAVDAVCAKLMGFDWQKIPSIKNAFTIKHFPICDFEYNDINVVSTLTAFDKNITEIASDPGSRFKPHFGWSGHIEL